MRLALGLLIGCLLFGSPAIALAADTSGPAMRCEDLANTDFTQLPDAPTSIITAQLVPRSNASSAYCRVSGIIAPQIGFELRLPETGWNGRYFQTGCGGFCGVIDTESCSDALSANFAVAAENMGHMGSLWAAPLWGADTLLRQDFGKRSTHVTAIAAKAIIARYYGRPAAFSYFRGCSTGGREGLSEAQFYPADFNGVIVGDPAFGTRLAVFLNNWNARQLLDRQTGAPVFSPDKLAFLHQAVLKSCDALDGLADGIIEDPRACHIDLAALGCPPAQDRPDCLTALQAQAARRMYDGPRDSQGRALYPGHQMYGSEIDWNGYLNKAISDSFLRYLAFDHNPAPGYANWDVDFDRDPPRVEAAARLYDPVAPRETPDLSGFAARGGKLIMYHGWADPVVPPQGSLDYYAKAAAQAEGLPKVRTWFRVFMVPGMLHCRGGDAPNTFDLLTPMVEWVEHGTAPERIIAVQAVNGTTVRTRPLAPYPEVARYSGKGDVNDAANWVVQAPARTYDDNASWIWAPGAEARQTP